MPIVHSSSPKAFSQNIRTLMNERGVSPHVKDKSQALAIAYATRRRAQHKRRGGKIKGYDTGGATDPVTAVIGALQAGATQATSAAGSNPGMNQSTPTPASAAPAATNPSPQSIGGVMVGQQPAPGVVPSPTPAVSANPVNPAATAPQNTSLGSNVVGQQPAPNVVPGSSANPASTLPQNTGLGSGGGFQLGGISSPMYREGGGVHRAFGGPSALMPTPWWAKQEARSMGHTGPILSAVPGRTDRHNMNVPSGSYVIPAESISHLGQSNTLAGMKIANNMFGASGPYGAGLPKMGHGMGAPKPPRAMAIPGDKGGARGEGVGTPVPVVTAGGEFVISPQVVARIGDGDIKRGHKILDAWIMALRKDHIRTLRKLKPPAKS
jgi:hypothetical protein